MSEERLLTVWQEGRTDCIGEMVEKSPSASGKQEENGYKPVCEKR